MSKFDERYIIRLAEIPDIDSIMAFIGRYWKKGHILSVDRDFFEYEHMVDGRVTYILAIDRRSRELEGICGYLPASRNKKRLDAWGVVWKVREDSGNIPFLGIELKKRLIQLAGLRTDLGVGANPKTSIPLLKSLMRYDVHKMRHYYLLASREIYRIAQVHTRRERHPVTDYVTELVPFRNIGELAQSFQLDAADQIPYKDEWYINKRYFCHPIYSYQIFGIREADTVQAILVAREISLNGSKVLRIVDYIGEQRCFGGLSGSFQNYLREYEYIDFYCWGFDGRYIAEAGFVERGDTDQNIIPNYFEPYECRNIDIWVDSSRTGCLFFKADGDQDRPNFRLGSSVSGERKL